MSSPQPKSTAFTTIDLDAPGKQVGFVMIPHSPDDDAWGATRLPIAVIANGDGPTAILEGGNHGDEYEGPVALFDLARSLSADRVKGRVIIVPAMNHPAFLVGTRTSPIDRGNLNRSFPGRPDGTVTQKIADYFTRTLLPLADIVLDIHSGGRTLDFVPFAAAHILPDKTQETACFKAVEAFSAPYSMKMLEIDAVGMYDTTAEEAGKTFVTTELGGGGTGRAGTIAIAKRGVANILRHAGILEGEPDVRPSRWLDMPSDDCFRFSGEDGLIETCVDLGEPVREGEVVARIYPTGRTGLVPAEYRAGLDGILVARHFPGLVKAGDCIAVVGTVLG